jgi:hypothetical protein
MTVSGREFRKDLSEDHAMLTRRTLCSALFVAVSLASFQVPPAAQVPHVLTCPRLPSENDTDWSIRCAAADRDRQAADFGERLQAMDRQRALYEQQPPLPPARNRLLGRWQTTSSGGDALSQLFGSISGCGALFGEGIVEFEPGRWAIHERGGRRDLGAVSYRSGRDGGVVALPAKGSDWPFVDFEFETPDRIHLASSKCTLVRTNAAVPPGRASAPAASPASRPAVANPAPAAARGQTQSNAAFEEALWKRWRGNFGYDCPNGEHVALDRCTSEAPNASCVIVRVGQPPRNGALVTFTETREALIKRIARCKLRPLRVVNGTLGFAP